MSREQLEIQPRQVSLLYHVLSEVLTPGQKDQYRGFALSLHSQRTQLDSLTSSVRSLMEPVIQELQVSTQSTENARKNLEFTQWFITWPNFLGYRGGLKAALGNARLALRFLPKIGVEEHPMVIAAKQEKETADYSYKVSTERSEIAETEALDIQTQIKQTKRSFEKTEADILNFAEMHAIPSQDTMRKYIGILPQRADKLATRYAQTYCADPDRVPNLAGFLNSVLGHKRRHAVPYKHLFSSEDRPLIDTPYHKLPPAIQNQLHSWISYQLRLEWANEDLIPKPDLPDSLRMV